MGHRASMHTLISIPSVSRVGPTSVGPEETWLRRRGGPQRPTLTSPNKRMCERERQCGPSPILWSTPTSPFAALQYPNDSLPAAAVERGVPELLIFTRHSRSSACQSNLLAPQCSPLRECFHPEVRYPLQYVRLPR
jgi:hypothetical protein